MLINNSGIYYSSLLNRQKSIVHGFTGRYLGDMANNPGNRQKLMQLLGLNNHNLFLPRQIHGDIIEEIASDLKNNTIEACDGLVALKASHRLSSLALGVLSADCLPIIFFESKINMIGVVHAGWRGTFLGITAKMIRKMVKIGGKKENIIVSFGPHIGRCCYDVSHSRALAFQKIYGKDERITAFYDQKWHLDLGYVNYLVLRNENILPENIDASVVCNACRTKEFYSYRKDKVETYGENMAFIAFR